MKLRSVFTGLLLLTMMICSSSGRVMPLLPEARTGRKMMAGDALIIGRTSKTSAGIHADDMLDNKKPTNNEQNPKRIEVQGKEAAPLKLVHPPSIAFDDISSDDSTCESRERKLDSVETANEQIFHLMRGDYSRGPPKAKRKPPINNHEPSD